MFRNYFVIIFYLLLSIESKAQYNYSSNKAHISIVKAIRLNVDIIEERVANFEKKAQTKPLMFVNVKRKISELNRVSNDLSYFITSMQKEVNTERILYELLEDDFYNTMLFSNSGELSPNGEVLKMKIDNLYKIINLINVHKLTGLRYFSEEHFNINEDYYDGKENKINYFEYLFYDKSNYGIMMTMYYLLLDVKVFQLMYYRTVMSY